MYKKMFDTRSREADYNSPQTPARIRGRCRRRREPRCVRDTDLFLNGEKFQPQSITNPFYTPSCNLGAVLSCGPVMASGQSAAFGFPNPFLGIAGFAVVAATGAAILGGAKLPTWYRTGLVIGTVLGAVFVCWLIYQSLFVIKALCPTAWLFGPSLSPHSGTHFCTPSTAGDSGFPARFAPCSIGSAAITAPSSPADSPWSPS